MAKTTEGTTAGKGSGIGPVSQKTWLIIAGSLMLFIIAGSLFSYVESTSSTKIMDVKQPGSNDGEISGSRDLENPSESGLISSKPEENQIFILEGKEFKLIKIISLDLPLYGSTIDSHDIVIKKSFPVLNGALYANLQATSSFWIKASYQGGYLDSEKITDSKGNIIYDESIIILKAYDNQGNNMICQKQELHECYLQYIFQDVNNHYRNKLIDNRLQIVNNHPENAKKIEAYFLTR